MNKWMNGVIGYDSALLQLFWAGDNLDEWDEFCYESCPWRGIDHSTCWQAVQRATTAQWMPQRFDYKHWFVIVVKSNIVKPMRFSKLIKKFSITFDSTKNTFTCSINMDQNNVVSMLLEVGRHSWYSDSALDCWPTGRAIDSAPGTWFTTIFISFAQVVSGPAEPYSAESWPKTTNHCYLI